MKETKTTTAGLTGRILTDVDIRQDSKWRERTVLVPRQKSGGYFGALIHAINIVRFWRPEDVVITGNIRDAALLGTMKRILPMRAPRLVSVESRFDNPRPDLTWRMKARFQQFSFQAFDLVCVSAIKEIRMYAERLALPEERFQFIPWHTNVIEPQIFPARSTYIFASGKTGRDWQTLAKAAEKLSSPVVVVATEADVSSLSFPDNVTVHTDIPYDDYRQLLEGARLVAMPLEVHAYSSGQVGLLEAMALGKPVVCTRVLGSEDYIVHGENGLFVAPGDADALADALLSLDDEDLARNMAEQALATVRAKHTFRRYVNAVLTYAQSTRSIKLGKD